MNANALSWPRLLATQIRLHTDTRRAAQAIWSSAPQCTIPAGIPGEVIVVAAQLGAQQSLTLLGDGRRIRTMAQQAGMHAVVLAVVDSAGGLAPARGRSV